MTEPTPKNRIWISAGLILLILALFSYFIDEQAVLTQIRQADWGLAASAMVLFMGGLILYALRWRFLLGAQTPRLTVFHAGNVGHLTNLLVPLRAGEPVRILLVSQGSELTIPQAVSSVGVERWFEQVMRLTALLAVVGLGAGVELTSGTLAGGLAFVSLALGGMILLSRKQSWVLQMVPRRLARLPRLTESQARQALTGLLDGFAGVSSTRRLMVGMIWSLLTWGSFLGFHLLALHALPDLFPLGQQLVVALGALALAPPSAPTQPGIYHASVVAPLGLVGFNTDSLTAYAVLLHGLQILGMGVFGTWGSLRLRSTSRQISSDAPQE